MYTTRDELNRKLMFSLQGYVGAKFKDKVQKAIAESIQTLIWNIELTDKITGKDVLPQVDCVIDQIKQVNDHFEFTFKIVEKD